uniref:NADH-ubiquinone oxidoreductase chain 2 n=1 Tax=Blastosporella zonata TaxID=530045 RepID=A0A386TXY5_9AGAR|nr:NADH dehydrogenase subunit 2 [Blastosporella zonata]YP_009517200.1 NADH dehydrogenase subunit 2 [Blastosporella zonata]AYE93079.1 NADH dehydrogenase subunit 2 [Blastosporella zonata]AYE93080.1 NADH dehydrogenase subunit 2 [Blastosporella zonata]
MIFISILTLIVAKALPSLNNHLSPVYFTRISALIFLYAGVLSFNTLNIQSIGSGIGIYSGLFQVTVISQFIEVFLFIIGSLILIAWPLNSSTPSRRRNSFLKDADGLSPTAAGFYSKAEEGPDYCLIVLFSTLGSCLLVSSSDLVSMYLSIELQSFGLYVLSTLYRDSESSTRAGLKYFLLGGLSSCLILLGSGLIYAFTGLTQFESIYSLISVSEVNNIIQGLSLGLILIIIGFLFKIAAAPLHNWSPDVYDETPTIVTIWLTIMPKIAILILLLELHTQIGVIGPLNSVSLDLFKTLEAKLESGLTPSPYFSFVSVGKNLLLISSFLSLIIGTVVGLAQTRIKRLFAYSTISHIGFILLALAINSEQSIDSFIFYIIQYSITNLDVFLIILALSYIIHPLTTPYKTNHDIAAVGLTGILFKDIRYISELKGQFFSNPLLSLSLSICLFSMAGIPPLIGFFSKQFVLSSAIQSGYYFIAFVAIVVSVVSASYYLKIIKVLLLPTDSPQHIGLTPSAPLKLAGGEFLQLLRLEGRNHSSDGVLTSSTSCGPKGVKGGVGNWTNRDPNALSNFSCGHSFLISTLTLSILFFILKTSLILNSTQLLTLSLFYF